MTVSTWKRSQAVYFLFSKAGKFKTSMARVPYNKLLTNLASSSRTGEYWPSVVCVRTSLGSVRTATTSGQYSPLRPSRSVSKRLLFSTACENNRAFMQEIFAVTIYSHVLLCKGDDIYFLWQMRRTAEQKEQWKEKKMWQNTTRLVKATAITAKN